MNNKSVVCAAPHCHKLLTMEEQIKMGRFIYCLDCAAKKENSNDRTDRRISTS